MRASALVAGITRQRASVPYAIYLIGSIGRYKRHVKEPALSAEHPVDGIAPVMHRETGGFERVTNLYRQRLGARTRLSVRNVWAMRRWRFQLP